MAYAPGISYQPFRADMSGWGQAILGYMGKKSDEQRLADERAKKDAADFKTYVAMGKTLGLNPDELTTKDLPTVKGMVEGHIAKSKLEEAVMNFDKMKRAAAAEDALARAVERAGGMKLGQALQQGQGPIIPQPVGSQDLIQSIVQNAPQAVNSPQATDLLKALQSGEAMGAKGGRDATPRIVDLNGTKVIVSDITGKYDVLPGTADSKLSDRLQVIDRAALQRRKTDITKALGNYLTPEVKDYYTKELDGINAQLGGATPEASPAPGIGGAKVRKYNPTTGKIE